MNDESYQSTTQYFLSNPSYDPRAHYERICQKFHDHPLNTDELARNYTLQLLRRVIKDSTGNKLPNDSILKALQDIVVDLLVDNNIYVDAPPEYGSTFADRNVLTQLEDCYDASRIEPAVEILEAVLTGLLAAAPDSAFTNIHGFSCPLIDLYPEPATFISYAIGTLSTAIDQTGQRLFPSLYSAYQQNIAEASGCFVEKIDSAKLTWPEQSSLTGQSLASAYLKNTPLEKFFNAQVLFVVPEEARTEHTFVLGPPGSGKTTLLERMICDDLAKDDPPAIVIIDPKGLMVERISKLDVFNPETGRLKDRLVIINPLADSPPALNLFDSASLWNLNWSEQVRNRIAEQTATTFSYVFSSSHYALTSKMGTPFSYAVQLLFKMPGTTIEDMFDLLTDKQLAGSRFAPFIEKLDSTAQRFFKNDFYGSTEYADTKRQIKSRIYDVLKTAPIRAMLYSKTRKIDLPRWIAEKKIVLINTCMGPLEEAHQLLGRYIISATFSAALSRVAIPKEQWHPAYLYIDEFGEFADETQTPRMLRLMREYKIGAILAHQSLHDETINDSLRATISTATSVKFATSPEGIDLNYAARDLRCEPDWLRQQTKTKTYARFGCFVRGHLEHPVSITMPFGMINKLPQMPNEIHECLIELKQREVASQPTDHVSDNEPHQADPVSINILSAPEIRQSNSAAEPEQPPSSAIDTPEAGSTW